MEPHSRRKSSVKGQCRWKVEHTLTRLNKEFEKLDFEKSELAYQEFERCKRNPG